MQRNQNQNQQHQQKEQESHQQVQDQIRPEKEKESALYGVSTPSYVIDEEKLTHNLEILAAVQEQAGCRILLAQKAFSAFCCYPLIGRYLSGTTASGLFEARLGRQEMGRENHVYAPAFKEEEIKELTDICDHISFNSISQLNRYGQRCADAGVSVGLRINPECSTQGDELSIYDPCAPFSRLGVTARALNEAAAAFAKEAKKVSSTDTIAVSELSKMTTDDENAGEGQPVLTDEAKKEGTSSDKNDRVVINEGLKGVLRNVSGLHFHTLCEQDEDALEITMKAVEEKFGDLLLLPEIKWLNMGGGHHITKEGYDRDALVRLIRRIREKYDVEVYLEPGEAIALMAGWLITTVMDVIDNGMPVVILDASAACHMPDVLEMPYTPPLQGAIASNSVSQDTDISGRVLCRLSSRTCLAGDIIGDYYLKEIPKVGDRLLFEDMAIYSMVKNNTFNGIPLPDIYLLHANKEAELIRRFSYEDFKGRLS